LDSLTRRIFHAI